MALADYFRNIIRELRSECGGSGLKQGAAAEDFCGKWRKRSIHTHQFYKGFAHTYSRIGSERFWPPGGGPSTIFKNARARRE
jgi:hypothetical protein